MLAIEEKLVDFIYETRYEDLLSAVSFSSFTLIVKGGP